MYNRYVPQQDGTYQKNRITVQSPPPQKPEAPTAPQSHEPKPDAPRPESALTFLRQLLPKNLDTADLLIIILLLLMAGDGSDNKNSCLLTLALYLFL